MKDTLAPIVLFVYNRPVHTRFALQALQKNFLASESKLFVFCDGPKNNSSNEAKKNIDEVREVVKSAKWCGEVEIIESVSNKGLGPSVREGVSNIVEEYGKVIVLEDDLITSPAFLTYMNKALAYYSHRKAVFSISGYNLPPRKMKTPIDYPYDVFACLRNASWGWATWDDRWKQIDWDTKAYTDMLQNPFMKKAFNRGGDDVFGLLDGLKTGKLNIWSIQFTLAHFANHAVTISPLVSYVDNLGLDGSGENCGTSEALRVENLNQKTDLNFLDVIYEDERLINAFYNAACIKRRPLWQKIINKLSRPLIGKNIYELKGKIYC